MKKDVLIIGGGAAGLMCAIEAGKRGRSVTVIEHVERLGKKILISGGGRCNFTNLHAGSGNFLSGNPHFCKSALARYTPADFIALVDKHGIRFHEKKLGQLFCDHSSKEIVGMLEAECAAARVEIRLGCRVGEVRKSENFQVQTSQGEFECNSLVIATGGISFPKLGATDLGYRLAKQFGVGVTETRPGLVPLTLDPPWETLSGVSIDTITSIGDASFHENILFTHRGLSGPAILQISNYCRAGEQLHINLLPDQSALRILEQHRKGNMELGTLLAQHLPRRFVQAWCERFASSRPMNRYSDEELSSIAQRLHRWEVQPVGTEGYAKAEVTLGGIDTKELSSKTMETRNVPGLYFIGEVVDVTGWLGGYNFQWAWASGFAAGQVV